MPEEPASVFEFVANGDGLKVCVGGVETVFLRDPVRELTVSVTEWRAILQATEFRERQDGTPTLLSHRLRVEAVGKLRDPIGFINGGPDTGEITEFPIYIHQYDADDAQRLKQLEDYNGLLREEQECLTHQFHQKPHTARLNFDPEDIMNNKYYPSTFLTIQVSQELMEEFFKFTDNNNEIKIDFYLKFFNLFSQVEKQNSDKITHKPLALCNETRNVLYGNLVSFSFKTIEDNQSVSILRENHSQRDPISPNLNFHQTTVQQNLQKISETLSYVLYVLCFGVLAMIFK